MPRSLLIAVAAGCASATVLLAALAGPFGGAMLAYLTPLPLLCVGLAFGSATVPIAAAAGFAWTMGFSNVAAAGVFGGMHALPSWLVVRQALVRRPAAVPGADPEWGSAGSVLTALTLLAGAATIAIGVLGTGAQGIEATVREVLQSALREALPAMPDVQLAELVEVAVPAFLGACAATWIIMIVVNAVLAQNLMSSRGWSMRPTPQWSLLELPDWMSWPLVAAAAVALIDSGDAGYIARNLVLVFATPFFLVGLAVVHRLVRRLPNRGLPLVAFYLGLALAFPIFAGFATLAGVIEQWWGIRRRFGGADID